MPVNGYAYPGSELELFQHARNWKTYYAQIITPFIKGRVLDVGAGLGINPAYLNHSNSLQWTLLEPDHAMFDHLESIKKAKQLPAGTQLIQGTIQQISTAHLFDSILYLDVLEHIVHDQLEIQEACARLAPGGNLIILAPAHQWLMSEFDRAIGHERRYSKKSLSALIAENMQCKLLRYADSSGLLASMANRYFLHQNMPNIRQIEFWDRNLVPLSRWTDRMSFGKLGKSVIGIWQKQM